MVDVRTLGTASISLDGDRRIGLVGHPDAFALFALIALEGPLDRPYLRRVSSGSGAPAYSQADAAAEAALGELLSIIEASLGRGAIRESDEGVHLDPSLDIRIDAARFEDALRRGDRLAAASEYGGSFLAGLPPPSSQGLRRWVETTRRKYAAAFAEMEGVRRAAAPPDGQRHAAAPGAPVAALTDPPRSRIARLMDRMRARLTYQVAVVYVMVAWVGLQVVDMLVDRDMLGHAAFVTALWIAIAGLPLVVLVAWARDEEGVSIGDYPATRGPWPRWIPRTRGRQTLAALVALLLIFATTFFVLRNTIPRAPAASVAQPDPASIAVLYFDDFSPDQDLGSLASGFTSDLIDQLNAVPSLDVRSLSAVKPYRAGVVPLDSVFRQLQVGTVVEGGLSRAGDSLRARVRLVAATETGRRVVASEDLLGSVGSELALGSSLAAEVGRLLREKLGVEIRERELRRETDSDAAWLLVQRAAELRDRAHDRTATDQSAAARLLSRADSLLAEAEEEDPDWIDPVVERGWTAEERALVETELAGNYDVPWARQALSIADRALVKAPEDARALELRGRVRFGLAEVSSEEETEELMRGAERDLLGALNADPDRPRAAWALSRLYRRQSRFELAAEYARRALAADYFFSEAQDVVWQLYVVANDLRNGDEATARCDEGRRRWQESARWYLCGLALLKSYGAEPGDIPEAWEWTDELLRLASEGQRDTTRRYALMVMAGVVAKAQLPDSARALIDRAREGERMPILDYDEAHAWVLLGEPDSALDRLESYVEYRPATRESLAADWWFESLAGNERFRRITRRSADG